MRTTHYLFKACFALAFLFLSASINLASTFTNTVANPAVSDQKAGSVLVFPYYTSAIDGSFNKSDTLITLTSVCNGPSTYQGQPYYFGAGGPNPASINYAGFVHLFFMDGANCTPADTYICLTPNASVQIHASVYDPMITGYLIAVVVDQNGVPTQSNCLIGSVFVRDDVNGLIGSYAAEAFTKISSGSLTTTNGYAAINFNGVDYDLAPTQFSVQVQDSSKSDEFIILASISGELGNKLNSTGQTGFGILYNAEEAPASFQPRVGSRCWSMTEIESSNFRVVPGGIDNFLKNSHGYMKFNVSGPAVGLLLSKQGVGTGGGGGASEYRWVGIRGLHKTNIGQAMLLAPIFPPFCGN